MRFLHQQQQPTTMSTATTRSTTITAAMTWTTREQSEPEGGNRCQSAKIVYLLCIFQSRNWKHTCFASMISLLKRNRTTCSDEDVCRKKSTHSTQMSTHPVCRCCTNSATPFRPQRSTCRLSCNVHLSETKTSHKNGGPCARQIEMSCLNQLLHLCVEVD